MLFLALAAIVALAVVAPLFLGPGVALGPPPDHDGSEDGGTVAPEPKPTPDPERYLPSVGSRGGFGRIERDGRYHLTYGFIDHHGQDVDVRCSIGRSDHEREMAGYGYSEKGLQAALNAELLALAKKELERRALQDHVTIRFHGWGGYQWESRIAGSPNAEQIEGIVAARDRWQRWMETSLDAANNRIQARLFEERGFQVNGDHVQIDYGAITVRATPALDECAAALERAAAGANERRTLGLYLAFFQELEYVLPPDLIDGRETLGLWTPTEVMANHHGDCDSKAVAFCAVWRRRRPQALIITLPEHALVAVEAKPGPGEHFVRLGNRYFVLCEVAGPGKIHPGAQSISGNYGYTIIPGT